MKSAGSDNEPPYKDDSSHKRREQPADMPLLELPIGGLGLFGLADAETPFLACSQLPGGGLGLFGLADAETHAVAEKLIGKKDIYDKQRGEEDTCEPNEPVSLALAYGKNDEEHGENERDKQKQDQDRFLKAVEFFESF